jgi:putative transcriptional regulator
MQLRRNLSTIMGKNRYNIQDVRVRTGLSRNSVSALYNNKATRIDFAITAKLCLFFECPVTNSWYLQRIAITNKNTRRLNYNVRATHVL